MNTAGLLLRGANLLDGEQPARPGMSVRVEGERIVEVREGPLPAVSGERVVELDGRTLMPGLVTTHFHSTYDDITILPQPLGLEAPPGYLAIVAARHLERALQEGFTSVVSAGAINDDIDAQVKLAIENGVIRGPHLLCGSRGLDTTGGYTDKERWWWQLGNHGAQRFCDGADAFRHAVRDEIQRGAEIIKLFPSGGHGVHEPTEALSFTPEELAACVDTAHERGALVRAHCPWQPAMRACLEAGVDVIDHGDRIDAALIDAMVEAGTFLVPSLYFLERMLADTRNELAATPVQRAPIEADYQNMRRWLPRANEAGVNLCIGDDYGIVILPHGGYAAELAFYVDEIGIPALDVIRWATRNGGELMGGDTGRIAAGMRADLLVVDGDPSRDIALLQDASRLLAIVKDGVFEKDGLAALSAA